MLSPDLARALADAGLSWTPAKGDWFVVPDRDLDEHRFVVSDMVIERVQPPEGRPILAFNGTTEWALDSLEAQDALWLPREDQLRTLLGDAFVSLEAVPGELAGAAVTARVRGVAERYVDVDAESAYARALLSLLLAGQPE